MQSIDLMTEDIEQETKNPENEQHDIKLLIATLMANCEALTTTVNTLASEIAEEKPEEPEEPEKPEEPEGGM